MDNNWPYISVREIAVDLGITRQRVHQIIKERSLGISKIGNLTLINREDYKFYLKLRKRRELAAAAGRKENNIIHSATHDTICDNCGGFAVKWERTISCENGHDYTLESWETRGGK